MFIPYFYLLIISFSWSAKEICRSCISGIFLFKFWFENVPLTVLYFMVSSETWKPKSERLYSNKTEELKWVFKQCELWFEHMNLGVMLASRPKFSLVTQMSGCFIIALWFTASWKNCSGIIFTNFQSFLMGFMIIIPNVFNAKLKWCSCWFWVDSLYPDFEHARKNLIYYFQWQQIKFCRIVFENWEVLDS